MKEKEKSPWLAPGCASLKPRLYQIGVTEYSGELGGLGACLMILLLISVVYYAVYRYTVHRMCAELEV